MHKGDITGLKADVGRGLESVSAAAAAASANVALLVQLERVKSRMEAACSKLKAWGCLWDIIVSCMPRFVLEHAHWHACAAPEMWSTSSTFVDNLD